VITVVRNGASTIADCLASVRSQTLNAEHIVWDGGSTDGTVDIIRRLSPRVHLHVGADAGLYDAMNKAAALATGDVIGFLNADDLYTDASVLESVVTLLGATSAQSCYGDLVYVDAADPARVVRYWRSGPFDARRFAWGWMPPHPTFFARRDVYARHGMFDTSLGTSCDYELMLRMLVRHRVSAAYLPRVLVRMREGGLSNATLSARLAANRMDREAWRVNGLTPLPWTLLLKPLRKIGQYLARPQVTAVAP